MASAAGTTFDRCIVAGPKAAPDIELHIYAPENAAGPLPCIYHIHGGGYVGGAPRDLEFIHRALVHELGCVLVSVDYRLAPEHPYPAALDDCVAAYRALLAKGISPGHIAIGGDSAGGNLTLVTALKLKALGLPLPEAVERTKVYVTRAVRKHHRWTSAAGQHTDALNHTA